MRPKSNRQPQKFFIFCSYVSIDEKDRLKCRALTGRVDALSSTEIQKVLDRLVQAGERMILLDFAEGNQEDVKRRWEFLKYVVARSFTTMAMSTGSPLKACG